jgi:hypothetical protein
MSANADMHGPGPRWIPEVAVIARRLYSANGLLNPPAAKRILRLGTDKRLAPVWKQMPGDKVEIAFNLACVVPLGTKTRHEVLAEGASIIRVADDLRRLAWAFKRDDPDRKVVLDAAVALQQRGNEIACQRGPLIVERNRNPIAKAYAILLSMDFLELFGQPHDKIVAIIATVALDLEVLERNVTHWRSTAS